MPNITYAIELELEPSEPGQSRQLIVWLDSRGRGQYARLCRGTSRPIAHVRPGDEIVYQRQEHRVLGVRPYRSHEVAAAVLPKLDTSRFGYVTPAPIPATY